MVSPLVVDVFLFHPNIDFVPSLVFKRFGNALELLLVLTCFYIFQLIILHNPICDILTQVQNLKTSFISGLLDKTVFNFVPFVGILIVSEGQDTPNIDNSLYSSSFFSITKGSYYRSKAWTKKFRRLKNNESTESIQFLGWTFQRQRLPEIFLTSTDLVFETRVSSKLLIWILTSSWSKTSYFCWKFQLRINNFHLMGEILLSRKCQ